MAHSRRSSAVARSEVKGLVNVVLLDADELRAGENHARVATLVGDRRATHLREVLAVGVGDVVNVAVIGEGAYPATVVSVDGERIDLVLGEAALPAPPASPLTLALALPRPPVFERVLASMSSMGVKRIHIFHAARVEKSYWTSRTLEPGRVAGALRLGMEQARDPIAPEVVFHRRFRPFAEDVVAPFCASPGVFVAHPETIVDAAASATENDAEISADLRDRAEPRAHHVGTRSSATRLEPASGPEYGALAREDVGALAPGTWIVVGPEGGFVDFELACFDRIGARRIDLGPRALRVEVAVIALIARHGLGGLAPAAR